jgi:type VI protein secretion system component VasK
MADRDGPRMSVEQAVRKATRKDAYFWGIMMLTVVLGSGASILFSVNVNHRQVLAERHAREQQQAAQRAAAEIGRKVTCSLIQAQNAVYQAEPPSSPTGIKAAKAWHDLSVQFHC